MNKRQKVYRTKEGKVPFDKWFERLKDRMGRAKIKVRTDRALQGNFGDYKSVGAGIIEMRVHCGPGYRIYVGLHGPETIVLLCGGDKSTQARDIFEAHEYWEDYRRRL